MLSLPNDGVARYLARENCYYEGPDRRGFDRDTDLSSSAAVKVLAGVV